MWQDFWVVFKGPPERSQVKTTVLGVHSSLHYLAIQGKEMPIWPGLWFLQVGKARGETEGNRGRVTVNTESKPDGMGSNGVKTPVELKNF